LRGVLDKRFYILAGNYGSGKTELSLNMALALAEKGRTALCDMDIVNPYFRSSENADMLEKKGIRLIKPPFANTAVDVPALSAEMYAAFGYDYAVFDAGGDPVGASALGGLKRYFDENREDRVFYYIVNARRPFQGDAGDAFEMLMQIERNARVKIDALVNNTNLAAETTAEDLVYGEAALGRLSKKTGLETAFASGTPDVLADYRKKGYKGEIFPIEIFTRPGWL
jgi:hypothetical protein